MEGKTWAASWAVTSLPLNPTSTCMGGTSRVQSFQTSHELHSILLSYQLHFIANGPRFRGGSFLFSQVIGYLYYHGMSCPLQAIHIPFSFSGSFLVSLCLCLWPGSRSHMFLTLWMWQWVRLPSRERCRLFPPTRRGFFVHQSGLRPAPSSGLVFGAVTSMRSICAMFPCSPWVPWWLWPMDVLG